MGIFYDVTQWNLFVDCFKIMYNYLYNYYNLNADLVSIYFNLQWIKHKLYTLRYNILYVGTLH